MVLLSIVKHTPWELTADFPKVAVMSLSSVWGDSMETNTLLWEHRWRIKQILRQVKQKASEETFDKLLGQILQEDPRFFYFPLPYKSLLSATRLLLGLDSNYPFNNITTWQKIVKTKQHNNNQK